MDHTWPRSDSGQIRFASAAGTFTSCTDDQDAEDPLMTFASVVRPALPAEATGQSHLQTRRVSKATSFSENARNPDDDSGVASTEATATKPTIESLQTLDFSMPSEKLKAALESQQTDNPQYWSYSMYQRSDGQKVTVHYCRRKDQSEEIAKHFLGANLLGFDLEWKMSLVKESSLRTPVPLKDRISLIQLATQDRIGLFHVAMFNGSDVDDLVPPTIKKIMEDEGVTKAGVNIGNDCNRLRKYLNIDSKGLFELSHLHRLVKYAETHPRWVNRKLVSLATQVQDHLLLPLKKDDVRTSDWTLPLRLDQIQYASSDVYASVHLFHVMDAKRRAMKRVPPLPQHWETKLPIEFEAPESSASEEDEAEDDPDIGPVAEDPDMYVPTSYSAEAEAAAPIASAQPRTLSSQSPELILAESWVTEYTARPLYVAKPRSVRPGFSELRAYALWQHHALDVGEIANLLKIKAATAASYVAAAVSRENLPCETQRLHAVLQCIPANVVQFRFARLFRDNRDALAAAARVK